MPLYEKIIKLQIFHGKLYGRIDRQMVALTDGQMDRGHTKILFKPFILASNLPPEARLSSFELVGTFKIYKVFPQP